MAPLLWLNLKERFETTKFDGDYYCKYYLRFINIYDLINTIGGIAVCRVDISGCMSIEINCSQCSLRQIKKERDYLYTQLLIV